MSRPTAEQIDRRVLFSRMRVKNEPHESTGIFPDQVIVALADDLAAAVALLRRRHEKRQRKCSPTFAAEIVAFIAQHPEAGR